MSDVTPASLRPATVIVPPAGQPATGVPPLAFSRTVPVTAGMPVPLVTESGFTFVLASVPPYVTV